MAAVVVRNVFVYGSLLAPEVLTAPLQRVPGSSLAVVHDYRRCSIKNRIYPAVLPNKGNRVFGKVLFDLSEQELYILDRFEAIEYTKLIVPPLTLVLRGNLQKAHDNDREVVDSAPQQRSSGNRKVPILSSKRAMP